MAALAASQSAQAFVSDAAAMRSERTGASPDPRIGDLLGRLYRAFSYASNQEPDWIALRSCFIDGAVFIGEAARGKDPTAQSVDALIAGWQADLRKGGGKHPGFVEVIADAAIRQREAVAHADVVFDGRASDDVRGRAPGLDSIQLVRLGPEWKVSAFVVQRESRLAKG
jgi:hypothetical protein